MFKDSKEDIEVIFDQDPAARSVFRSYFDVFRVACNMVSSDGTWLI